ncbi:MAG: carboxylating nicotinate-nucleotide diphosphorylase [Victivallaceae bacterium]|nr:carboxylating nicotinate-nucleotide diphosphorylase [Victivallaceae bacterium]
MAKLHPAGIPAIDWARADHLIELALSEDLDLAGDATTLSVIPERTRCRAVFRCKENEMVLAGLPVAEKVFGIVDGGIVFTAHKKEGDLCRKGDILAEMEGPARSILTAERTALNFLQRLCGVATTARRYAEALKGTKCVILDTRKTTPGYRNLEKYAVAVGGAVNHRIGLFDMIMIKDNHRELASLGDAEGIVHAVERARAAYPDLAVEVEADRLEEVEAALRANADCIMLDNMDDDTMARAVKLVSGRAELEASGGITLERLGAIGRLGVDYVSAGALTHSVKSADISLDVEVKP